MPGSVLTFKDLKDKKGLNYTRQHVARMVREGRFPKATFGPHSRRAPAQSVNASRCGREAGARFPSKRR